VLNEGAKQTKHNNNNKKNKKQIMQALNKLVRKQSIFVEISPKSLFEELLKPVQLTSLVCTPYKMNNLCLTVNVKTDWSALRSKWQHLDHAFHSNRSATGVVEHSWAQEPAENFNKYSLLNISVITISWQLDVTQRKSRGTMELWSLNNDFSRPFQREKRLLMKNKFTQ